MQKSLVHLAGLHFYSTIKSKQLYVYIMQFWHDKIILYFNNEKNYVCNINYGWFIKRISVITSCKTNNKTAITKFIPLSFKITHIYSSVHFMETWGQWYKLNFRKAKKVINSNFNCSSIKSGFQYKLYLDIFKMFK